MDISQISMLGQSSGIDKIKSAAKGDKQDEKLLEAARDFEAILLNQMLASMRKTLPGDSVFGGGYSGDMYKSMYDDYLTREIVQEGRGIGLAEILHRQISSEESRKE